MAKGLYRLKDGRVTVDFGKRQIVMTCAQYRANGYLPAYDRLRVESLFKSAVEKAGAPRA